MADAVRPRLRQDTAFLQTAEGVYVRSRDSAIVVKGGSAYRWLTTIGRHLDGRHTVEQLCRDLSPAHRQTVAELVSMLLEKGFARAAADEPADPLLEPIRNRFASQIAFIEHFADAPVRRFMTFRQSRVLLLGSGDECLASVGAGLLRNGLATLTLAKPVSDLTAEAEQLTAEGCTASIVVSDGAVEGYDLVVFCGGAGDLASVFDLNERCVRDRVPFLPATVIGRSSMLGPLVRPGGACWLCALLRVTTNIDPAVAAETWRAIAVRALPPRREPVPSTVARMLGTAVAFEAFSRLSGGLPAETEGNVVMQDIDTLESTRETLLPHPLCPACGDRAVAVAEQPAPLDDDEFDERCADLFNRHVGMLREYADDGLPQIPLKVGVVRLAEPARDVTAFAVESVRKARIAAVAASVVHYTQHQADPGRLVIDSASALSLAGHRPVVPPDVPTWSGAVRFAADRPLAWTRGESLRTGEPRHVPAAAVFPLSKLNDDAAWEPSCAGLGVGRSPREAAMAGLISALGHVLVLDLVRGRAAAAALDVERVRKAKPQLEFLVSSAELLGTRVELLEVIAAHGVHAVLARVPSVGTWSIGVGRSGPEAAEQALLDLVGRLQLPDRKPSAETLLGALTTGAEFVAADPTDPVATRFAEPAAADDCLLDLVAKSGRDAVFIDTTTLDLRMHGVFHTGRVVLVGAGHDIRATPGSPSLPTDQ